MIERVALESKVYAILKERIFTSRLSPGERIDIDRLVAELGVSRTPIKDALNRLAQEGLVTVIPHRGTFVTELSRRRLAEVFDARAMIARYTAEVGLPKVTPEHLAAMRDLLAREASIMNSDRVTDHLGWSTINRDLHQLLVDIAGNEVISEIHRSLNVDINVARVYDVAKQLRPAQAVHAEHMQIVECYEAGDLPRLLTTLTDHLNKTKDAALEALRAIEQ